MKVVNSVSVQGAYTFNKSIWYKSAICMRPFWNRTNYTNKSFIGYLSKEEKLKDMESASFSLIQNNEL